MTAEDSPNESSDGEEGVIQRIGDNNASQTVWKMTACPVQNKNAAVSFRRN
jgi:hypothetical protein